MTLGEKIRHARKSCNLSQVGLAEKLCVSRSAIAKWETDKGVPDVENLKYLSRLLNVSVDYLLSDDDCTESAVIREAYQLAACGRGCRKVKKDRFIRQRFPDAKISTLLGRPELAETAQVVDSIKGFLTAGPFGVPEFLKSVRDTQREFYLVETQTETLFVTVTDTFAEIRPFPAQPDERSFRLGNWVFIRCDYLSEE